MELCVGRLTLARLDFVACDVINWWVILGEGCRSLAIAGRGRNRGCLEKERRRLPAWATGGRAGHVTGSDSLTAWAGERMNEWVSEWVSDVCYLTDFQLTLVLIMSRSVCMRVCVFGCVCMCVCVCWKVIKSKSAATRSKQAKPLENLRMQFSKYRCGSAATTARTQAHTHLYTCGYIERLLRALRRNRVPGWGRGVQRKWGVCCK